MEDQEQSGGPIRAEAAKDRSKKRWTREMQAPLHQSIEASMLFLQAFLLQAFFLQPRKIANRQNRGGRFDDPISLLPTAQIEKTKSQRVMATDEYPQRSFEPVGADLGGNRQNQRLIEMVIRPGLGEEPTLDGRQRHGALRPSLLGMLLRRRSLIHGSDMGGKELDRLMVGTHLEWRSRVPLRSLSRSSEEQECCRRRPRRNFRRCRPDGPDRDSAIETRFR